MLVALAFIEHPTESWASGVSHSRFSIPSSARQLIVVSSSSYDPAGHLARLQTFERPSTGAPWKAVSSSFATEIGSAGLRDIRREGDHTTPTGVYPIGAMMFGNKANPGGLHSAYHQLICGDWWDEDPYSPKYNQFVHVRCGSTPVFASWSEALWTETNAYPYLAVINFNDNPTISGADAPGSGIFLHAWVGGGTAGCVALPLPQLLSVLRWLRPADHPVIEIGTTAEIANLQLG